MPRLWLSPRTDGLARRCGPVLVPVHLVDTVAGGDVVFEVLLAAGRTLRFGHGVPTDDLAAVCEALERPCSR